MRSTWTDSRLDDFAKHTDQRFDKLERAVGEVRAEVIGVRGEVHALQRTIIGVGGGLMAAVIGVIATQL